MIINRSEYFVPGNGITAMAIISQIKERSRK